MWTVLTLACLAGTNVLLCQALDSRVQVRSSFHTVFSSQLVRVCAEQNGRRAEACPGEKIWDTEATGGSAKVPRSFNELKHLFLHFVPPSPFFPFSSGQVQPAPDFGSLQLEGLILLSPQSLQSPPKVWGHLDPCCQQLSQSLFGSLGEHEIAGDRALFKGDPACPCH